MSRSGVMLDALGDLPRGGLVATNLSMSMSPHFLTP